MTLLLSACRPAPVSPELVTEVRTAFAARSAETTTRATSTIVGSEDWFFYAPELRHVSVGQFWDEHSGHTDSNIDGQTSSSAAAAHLGMNVIAHAVKPP